MWITAEKLPPGSGVYATAKTDKKGKFTFENIPTSQPMWFVVNDTTGFARGRYAKLTTTPYQYSAQPHKVTLILDARNNSLSAEVTEPDPPITSPSAKEIGRRVRGRIVDPNHASFDYSSLKASIAPETPGFFLDQDGKWPEGEQHSQFLSSPAGQAYQPYVRIERDGNFEIDSVLPARYELRIFIPGAQSADGKMKTLKTHYFEVLSYDPGRELAQGRDWELDLGTFTVHPSEN